jgi:hypothetical protein
MVLEDLGDGAASPWAAHPGTSMLAPHLTESHSKLSTLSPGWGPETSTSMLVVPYDARSALSITRTSASHASNAGPSNTKGPVDAFVGHGGTGVTTIVSPTLAAHECVKRV